MSIERESPTWRTVKAHCQTEIEKQRDSLETQMGEGTSMVARGRIAALREILALADVKPEIIDSPELY